MRIELCGGMGSGKTTLALALEKKFHNYIAVLEAFSNAGFFSEFYDDIHSYAYETSITCLLYHLHRVKVFERQGMMMICDFSLEQDWAYAKNNLNSQEWQSFLFVYEEAIRQIQPPDLIVFLDCPEEVLLSRIKTRGRKYENSIDVKYIQNIISVLEGHLEICKYPVFKLNSFQYDFRNSQEISKILMELPEEYHFFH